MRSATLLLALIGSVAVLSAQVPALPTLRFDQASISPNETRGRPSSYVALPDGSVHLINMTVREMIARAFGIAPNLARFLVLFQTPDGRTISYSEFKQVVRGYDWRTESRFDVIATAALNSSPDEHRVLIQSLLAQRFGLVTHTEMQELPVYALRIAPASKLRSPLRPSQHDCDAYTSALRAAGRDPATDPQRPRAAGGLPWCSSAAFVLGSSAELVLRRAGDIRTLIDQVQGFVERPILDHTALKGNFEWVVRLARMKTGADTDASDASILSALEQQLGLTLEPLTVTLEVLVIDSVERPTPN